MSTAGSGVPLTPTQVALLLSDDMRRHLGDATADAVQSAVEAAPRDGDGLTRVDLGEHRLAVRATLHEIGLDNVDSTEQEAAENLVKVLSDPGT
jgi:hypothetical protein